MKRLLIGDTREKLLATVETILKHWGYRALASSRRERLLALLQETTPDLLIMGEPLLADGNNPLREKVFRMATAGTPLLVLSATDSSPVNEIPHERLPVPIDLFTLFEKVQKHLEKYPRKNIRLPIKLPGMLCLGKACHLAEVLSLSARGLFIKTGFRLQPGDHFYIIFPLLGMKKEVELEGRVLYCVHPDPENNFLQGVGIEFTSLDGKTRESLQAFIEGCFLNGLPRQLSERLANECSSKGSSHEATLRFIIPDQLPNPPATD